VSDEGLLRVNTSVAIPLDELEWKFSTSGGPGGQHVDTSNTRAEVRFDIACSRALSDEVRSRLIERIGPVVQVAAGDRRSQLRNRDLALERLAGRLAAALAVETPRRPTRPTLASRRRRLDTKRRQAARKRDRQAGWEDQ